MTVFSADLSRSSRRSRAMAGLQEFIKGLPESRMDSVFNVVHDLQDSTAPERIESLRQFLYTLTREIDQINRKRDALGQKVANIEGLLPAIEEHLRVTPNLEVELFKNILLGWRAALKNDIAELRPNGKLEKKYDTERKRDLLVQLQSVVEKFNALVRSKGADSLHSTKAGE